MRYKLTIAYRGTRYHGWQAQALPGGGNAAGDGLPTIQQAVSRALTQVVRHPVQIVGSSRTDSGVHAKGQIAHFDTDQVQIPVDGLRRAANHALPGDVLIRSIEAVPDAFHAIHCTLSKRYQYFIWNDPDRSVFAGDLSWHRWQVLDIAAVSAAAQRLVGTHDFAAFARPGHGRLVTVRTIHGCDVTRRGPRLVIGVESDGFLWHMVRIIVGTLVEVGLGRYGPERIDQALGARNRQAAGPTAPPHGLYLQWIRSSPVPQPALAEAAEEAEED